MQNVIEKGGVKLHADMLMEADKAIQGKGDGRVSGADAQKIGVHLKNTDSNIGQITLQHIKNSYKLTPAAQRHFDGLLSATTPLQTKTITIDNITPFYIKIFEQSSGKIGTFVHLLAPHASYQFQPISDKSYIATLALDRMFTVKTFAAGTATVSIAHSDLKSIKVTAQMPNPENYQGTLKGYQYNNTQIYEMLSGGGEKESDPDGVEPFKIYVQKSTEDGTILGYFVTMMNTKDPFSYGNYYDSKAIPSPNNPNNNYKGYKRQTWYVPNYIKGTKTKNGYTIDVGRSKGRLTNAGAGLHLYTGEVMVCAQANFKEGSDFWILKGDCQNVDAFLQTAANYKSQKNSIQLGPGTMATLNKEYDNKGTDKDTQEIGKNCNQTDFPIKSFTVMNIEAPSSAGLTIHHELAEQHIPAGTYYRTIVVANAFVVSKAAEKVSTQLPDAALKSGRPTTLYIESSESVKDVIINGKSFDLAPNTGSKISVPFSKLGQVQILIKPTSKSIRVPNLFFYTDKMDSSMRVMTDPNKQVHQRLATGSMQIGNFKPAKVTSTSNLSSKSINDAGKDGDLGDGLHKWLSKGGAQASGQWDKIVNMTHKTNKAILHVHHKDAAGLHTHAHVDASHMGGFEDIHFNFKVQEGQKSTLNTIKKGGKVTVPKKGGGTKEVGRYVGFVQSSQARIPAENEKIKAENEKIKAYNKKHPKNPRKLITEVKPLKSVTSLKEMSDWVNQQHATSSVALVASPDNIFDDIWHGVTDVVMTVGHAIEEGVESALHFVVAIGDRLCHLAISAADEIVAVLKKIYDTIKLLITNLIDFIKFLIELLEDVGKMANAIATTITDAVDYFDGKLSSFTTTSVQDFFKVLDFPTQSTYSPPSSSNPDIDSAFEKFHWLMNLITQGASDGKSGGSNALAGDIYKAVFDEIKKLFKDTEALGATIEDCFKDPKNAGSILADFLAKLAGGFESPIEDLVDDVVKGLSTSIKSTLTGDFPGLPSGVSSLLDKIGIDLSPAHVLGLLVGLPSTMLYGVVKGDVPTPPTTFWQTPSSSDLALTTTPQSSMQATFISAIGMITDLFAAAASPLTIVNAKGNGGDDSKFLALFSGLGKLAGSTISAITAATDWTGDEKALIYRDTMIGLSLFRGIFGIYTYKAKAPKVNCAIDMLLGSVKVACGVCMLEGGLKSIPNNTANAIIQFAEGAGLVCELDGFADLGGADAVFIGGAAIAPLVGSGAKLYLLAEG